MKQTLVIIRGNAGSGKSTVAKLLREIMMENGIRTALVEQDYLRRIVLKEKEKEGGDNIGLIKQTVEYAWNHDYCVVLEGILYSKRYSEMIRELRKLGRNIVVYLDIPFEETLKRHQTKPNRDEFGEKEMKEWFRESDVLRIKGEIIIDSNSTAEESAKKIFDSL